MSSSQSGAHAPPTWAKLRAQFKAAELKLEHAKKTALNEQGSGQTEDITASISIPPPPSSEVPPIVYNVTFMGKEVRSKGRYITHAIHELDKPAGHATWSCTFYHCVVPPLAAEEPNLRVFRKVDERGCELAGLGKELCRAVYDTDGPEYGTKLKYPGGDWIDSWAPETTVWALRSPPGAGAGSIKWRYECWDPDYAMHNIVVRCTVEEENHEKFGPNSTEKFVELCRVTNMGACGCIELSRSRFANASQDKLDEIIGLAAVHVWRLGMAWHPKPRIKTEKLPTRDGANDKAGFLNSLSSLSA